MICPIADKYNNFEPIKVSNIDGVNIIQPFQFKTKRLEINLLPYIIHTTKILLSQRTDLIYIYKPTPISIVGLIPKLFFNTRLVLDMDDVGSEVMKIEGHPLHQRKMVEWSERLALYYSDLIVAASTYLSDLFAKQYPNKPIIVISNAVDSNWFEPITYSEVKNRIVFLGAINRKNILEPLIEAAKNLTSQFPDLKILIIGDGKYFEYFKNKISSMDLEKFFDLKGWLSIDEARGVLKAGDIGYNYMPDELTTKSASNMKVPQYMARGVVPLVSDVGDLPRYVDFGSSGYICKADDQVVLEQTITAALNDPNRLIKAENAANYSREVFSWDKLAKKFSDWILQDEDLLYFVSTTCPGKSGGTAIRNQGMIKMLSEINLFKLVSFSTIENIKEENIQNEFNNIKFNFFKINSGNFLRILKSVFIDRLPPFFNDYKSTGMGEEFFGNCKKKLPKYVHLEQIHSYYCVKGYLPWLKSNGVKIIFDAHNIESKIFEESLSVFSPVKRLVGKLMVNKYKKLEIEAIKNSDLVLCCSEIDKEFFIKYNKNVHVIPNGVSIDDFKVSRTEENNSILFVGGVEYPPNEDAVRFYLNDIHPIVKREIPNVKFYLIGADKNWSKKNRFEDPSILSLGYVDDINQYLEKASIGICPLRYGSGTRLKILTYLAAGLPVVSTRKGAEGVNYTNKKDLVLVDQPEKFAAEIINLLKNKSVAMKLGQDGHDFVKNNYDWKIIKNKLIEIYNK
jgi:glycosyltransferase involved in cell wall biosynthesis